MPTVTIDGYDYIGYVEAPVLGLKLPVMAEWDYDRLKIAPCRRWLHAHGRSRDRRAQF